MGQMTQKWAEQIWAYAGVKAMTGTSILLMDKDQNILHTTGEFLKMDSISMSLEL